MRKFYTTSVFLSFVLLSFAQSWTEKMQDNQVNFYEVQEEFNAYWGERDYERGKGFRQYKRWEWFTEPRVYPSGDRPANSIAFQERAAFDQAYPSNGSRNANWQPWGPSSWTTVSTGYNPGIGRVNFIVEDPNNSDVLYVGAPSGGLWKSTNAGADWEPLTDDFSAIGVTGIAINPSNSQEIYISTGDGFGGDTYSIGVFKSNDGGNTWMPTGMSNDVTDFIRTRRLKMHPTNPNILLLATNQGLFKTADGGDNWDLVANGNFRDIEYHPTNDQIVYASTNRFLRSVDGGDNFSFVNTGTPTANQVNRMELAVSPDDPDRVYAVCGDAGDASFYGLYRSDDAGVSFSLTANSPNIFGYSTIGDDTAGQSWYDLAIAADPNDADHVFIGGINVWETTDAGSTFTINSHWIYPTTYNYTHADIHALEFYGDRLYCGSDGGIFISYDQGGDFIDLTDGLEITQFYRIGGSPQNSNVVIGGTQDNGSNLYDGNQWTHVMGADGMQARIDPSNPNIMYCAMQFGNLHASYDGGQDWFWIFNGDFENGNWVTPYDVNENGNLYIGYENVWLSTDNGMSFNMYSTDFTSGDRIRCLSLAKSDLETVYISYNDLIYRTINDGASWQNITANLPGQVITDIEVHPTNRDIVYVTLSGYTAGEKIYLTTDGGGSWDNITQNLPNLPANTVAFQEGSNGGLYIGTDVGIYYIDSTLSNWQSYDAGLPNVIVNDLEIHYGANHIKAGTYGRGLWVSDLYSPSELAPVANFSYKDFSKLCHGDSVSFTDLSLNASPNWTWYFPGGSPSTSNLASPKVSYSSPGVYEVSLVMGNAFGTDSIAQTIEIEFGDRLFDMALTTDDYPTETTWTIVNEDSEIVAQGGNYGSANTLYNETVCLDSGCYVFTIYDAYGDGICCDWGEGGYIIEVGGDFVAEGGEFNNSEEVHFCVESSLNVEIQHPTHIAHAIKLFPNPAQEEFTLMPSENIGEYELVIYDAMGKVVFHDSKIKGTYSLNIEHFNIGTYFIKASSKEGVFRDKLQVLR
jgi:PKD repeat protein